LNRDANYIQRGKGSGFRVQMNRRKSVLSTDLQDYQDYEMQEYWNIDEA
jgi:hypothetical protein